MNFERGRSTRWSALIFLPKHAGKLQVADFLYTDYTDLIIKFIYTKY